MRVVSLLPSSTEIVCELELGHLLVGRSHECDFPASIQHLPTCTQLTFPVDGTSAEIHAQVEARLAAAVSLYSIDWEQLVALQPELLLTQSQCAVCAVSVEEVQAAAHARLATLPRLVDLAPLCLADVWANIEEVATVLGHSERGHLLRQRLEARVAAVAAAVKDLSRPTVGCLEWLDPLMAAGNWIPELVELAGGRNVLGIAGQHSPWLPTEQLLAADPDVLVLLPCGFGLERTRQEMSALTRQPWWQTLRVVQMGRVYVTDGNQFFNRPGPRLAESVEILAEMFHPDHVAFGHAGRNFTVGSECP